ncbi:hypothetical protein Hanom_Chr06g00489311 [Helianthus anomalus]
MLSLQFICSPRYKQQIQVNNVLTFSFLFNSPRYYRSLFLQGRGKTVYILPSSAPTLALLLGRFTEYDDDLTRRVSIINM